MNNGGFFHFRHQLLTNTCFSSTKYSSLSDIFFMNTIFDFENSTNKTIRFSAVSSTIKGVNRYTGSCIYSQWVFSHLPRYFFQLTPRHQECTRSAPGVHQDFLWRSSSELGHRGGIHRVGATSTAFYSKVTPSTGGSRWKWTLFWHQNPPPKPTSKKYFVYLFRDYLQTFLFF